MNISHLRNLAQVRASLSPGINLFAGANGSGKTSLLEAIHLAAHGRSFRSGPISGLISHNEESVVVRVVGDEATVALERTRAGEPLVKVNGERVRRMSLATRHLPVQTLLPGVSDLIFGPPGDRREWLDWGLFHVEHGYHDTLRRYQRVLSQRNAALKQVGMGLEAPGWATNWDKEFVELAEAVGAAREGYLARLQPLLKAMVQRFLPAMDITWTLQPGFGGEQSLSEQMVENLPREVKSGATIAGPHRADVVVWVAAAQPLEQSQAAVEPGKARAATHVLSRGQGKLVAAAMKLGQAEDLAERAGSSGVLLLDDVGAELDAEHTERLLSQVVKYPGQVVATSTELHPYLEGLERESKTFHVKHGEVVEQQLDSSASSGSE
ncbi:MAG: DNA replication and repair protein RecF [Pseudomonadaceae bacterium]|nr:DNA replication and repair protein RecF [Pseudomonadaceae bacterium]